MNDEPNPLSSSSPYTGPVQSVFTDVEDVLADSSALEKSGLQLLERPLNRNFWSPQVEQPADS